ncbi:MAG: hypothetical protein U9N77_13055, partial [Thermodesulfobacteriota bacterium]|nr:hypothetical protein [Thermodesulfobacteriota bacterium]
MQDITPPMVLPPAISVDLVSFSSVAEDGFSKSAPEVKDSDALPPEPELEPELEKKELLPEHEAEPVQTETVPEIKVKPKVKP